MNPQKAISVLLIGDNDSMVEEANRFLIEHNIARRASAKPLLEASSEFNVLGEFSSGKVALEACIEFLPDVAFLHYPDDMSQFEFVEQYLQLCPNKGLVVARSSWGADEMRDMMILGVRSIIFKPYDLANLYQTIRMAKDHPPTPFQGKGIL